MNIAIVSPNNNVYSETFIDAQKRGLKGRVFYYYGGDLPLYLENHGALFSKKKYYWHKLKRKLGYAKFNTQEFAFIDSLKSSKVQVVLAQYGTTAHRILKICDSLNLPLVTHFHGFDASVDTVIKNCNFYKEVFSYSVSVIAVSKKMKQMLVELGCEEKKIVYNSCAPQQNYFNVKPTFSEKSFISVGRFIDKKAPYYVIMAFKKVVSKYPEAKLYMAGDGILLNTCVNLVKQLNLESQVQFLGVISPSTFRDILARATAFVQHSITAKNGDMEGTPVSVLEASAAGIPVISTYHAGIPESILHKKTGLLVNEHEVDKMGDYMIDVLNSVRYAKSLGAQGKNHIKENFSFCNHINTLQGILEAAVK